MSIHEAGFSDEKNQSRYVTFMLKSICQYLYQVAEEWQIQKYA